MSRSLLATGMKKGDIVFLIGVTDIEFFVWYFAILQVGLVYLYVRIQILRVLFPFLAMSLRLSKYLKILCRIFVSF